jgi:photosystem II stability/assembly factor-like uncharacterized protein
MDKKLLALGITIGLAFTILLTMFLFVNEAQAITVNHVPTTPLADPIIISVNPETSPNDVDTSILIYGTGFTATISGTQVITTPLVYLGEDALPNVFWVNTSTLTATVPWGKTPGIYTITVSNPDGVTGTLQNAFTVTDGFDEFLTGGPYGGMVMQLAMKPESTSSLYATTYGAGVFFSENSAENWEPIHNNNFPIQLDFDVQNADVLYLGSDSNDLYRSLDNGNNWENISDGFHVQQGCFEAFPAAHPSQAGYIYFGMGSCRGIGLESDEGGVYFSTDYGDNWVARNNGLTDLDINVLAIHPNNPTVLVAGTYNGNVFTSTNNGLNWTLATQLTGTVSRLYFNPYETLEIWAITRTDTDVHAGGEGYLYRSTNLADWTVFSMNINPGGPAHAQMAFLPDSVWLASGSVYSSTDSGANWNEVYSPNGAAAAISISPGNPSDIFIGTDAGIEKSTDSSSSWQNANKGLAALVPYAVTASHSDPDIVYVKTHQDIFISYSGGNAWIGLDHNTGTHPGGDDLVLDYFNNNQLYMTTECQGEFCIDISTDGGYTWNEITSTLPVTYSGKRCGAYVIAPSPHNTGEILVGAAVTPPDGGDYKGLFYRSDDYGVTWNYFMTTQPISRVTDIAYDSVNSDLIYAGTEANGLWRSTDGGDTWSHIPISNTQPPVGVSAIAIHPDVPSKVYLRSYSFATTPNPEPELWVSNDAGNTWQPMAYVSTGVDLVVSPPLPAYPAYKLFTGCDSTLCQSGNEGQSWQKVDGAPRPEILTAVSDGVRTILYLGTPGVLVTSAGMQTASLLDSIPGRSSILGGGIYRITSVLPTNWIYMPSVLRMR